MQPDPTQDVYIDRARGAIAERIVWLRDVIEAGKLVVSEPIATAIDNRLSGTEIDAWAKLLGLDDTEIRKDAARCIEFVATHYHSRPGWAVWFVNEETPTALLAGLSDKEPCVRRDLLRAYPVLKFGDPADVLPLLVQQLGAEQEDLRFAALQAIEAVGTDLASGVVTEIAALADDPVPNVRRKAYEILARLGRDAISVLPTLVGQVCSGESDRKLRRLAMTALIALNPSRKELMEAAETVENQEALIAALRRSGKAGRSLRHVLSGETKDDGGQKIELWLVASQIAKQIGCSSRTVRRMLGDGRVKPLDHRSTGKKGRVKEYLINIKDLPAFKARSRQATNETQPKLSSQES